MSYYFSDLIYNSFDIVNNLLTNPVSKVKVNVTANNNEIYNFLKEGNATSNNLKSLIFNDFPSPLQLPLSSPLPSPHQIPYQSPERDRLTKIFQSQKNTAYDLCYGDALTGSHIKRQKALGLDLGKIYKGPISNVDEISKYLPEKSSIKNQLIDEDYKFEMFLSRSGVPILMHHRLDKSVVPYEALYNTLETTDLLMASLEPHVKNRILNNKLVVRLIDRDVNNLGEYSGWYRLAGREGLENNQIDVTVNSMLPKMSTGTPCEVDKYGLPLKPATSRSNVLVHEFTHAVQALLPYKDPTTGKIKNWNKLTEFPPHIQTIIDDKLGTCKLEPISKCEEAINQQVVKAASIGSLSEEDLWLAKDIVFNREVEKAFEAAQLNPKYKEPISKMANHGDYQMQTVEPGCSDVGFAKWISAGTEYFAELVAGAFGMNAEYALSPQETGLEKYTGRMSSLDWIEKNDPVGLNLVQMKFKNLNHAFCEMPLLDTMPYCKIIL